MEKQFSDLTKFLIEKRDVELFRSSDQKNTATYFTESKKGKAFFEVLRFGLDGGDHQLYIRFPNTDYFTEMVGGGWGSSHGNMMVSDGENIYKDEPFTIYSHDNNLLIAFGDSGFPSFNFLVKVAEYNSGNPFDFIPKKTCVNYSEIKDALSMKCLMLPQHVRNIEYIYKTNTDTELKYFIVDYPAYNSKYSNFRFRIIEDDEIKEYPIKKLQRFKDGGTTLITIIDENGTEHKLHSPQSIFPTDKKESPTFDLIELTDVTSVEKNKIITHLGIELKTIKEK